MLSRPLIRRRSAFVPFAASLMVSGILVGAAQSPAAAAVTAVKGEACSYYVNVGLFGGPQERRGCGGVTSRSVSDGVTTSGSTTVSSASAAFTSQDVGAAITATVPGSPGQPPTPIVPPGTTITSVTNATTVVLSAAPTVTATGVTLKLTYPTRSSDISYSPNVTLPSGGGSAEAHDETCPSVDPCSPGAKAQYGPAVIHGGQWPDNVAQAQPSGPQHASTSGSTGTGGSVTSSASITLNAQPYPAVGCATGYTPPCLAPGGFGPPPVWGDSLSADCQASETAVTGSATFSNAFVAKATDADGAPLPSSIEAIPNPTPVNHTVHGVISNVGDVFTAVFNQQIVNPDGSLTVNAAHMYLFGPVAVGEVVRGQVTCGVTPSPLSPNDTVAPTCGTVVVKPVGPEDPTPQVPRQELVGTFDAGGLQSITNVQVVNGTVDVGADPAMNPEPYLVFAPGQTGPLPISAKRTAEAEAANRPLQWSFDAIDSAGNTSHCQGFEAPPAPVPTKIGVFRPSNGVWFINGGVTTAWGTNGDIPVPSDYSDDGTADIAVFRPSTGTWFVNGGETSAWGTNGDIPLPGDYGYTPAYGETNPRDIDIAVFRPSSGTWFVKGGDATAFGTNGDIPVPADYNNDGTLDIAVFRPSTGTWFIQGRPAIAWGTSGDVPVPADYNDDGRIDIAVYRPSTGTWFVRGGEATSYGTSGDRPVPADYTGDGRVDIAVFRPSSGVWFVKDGASTPWGTTDDVPVPMSAT